MADTLAASLANILPGFRLGASGEDAANRFSLDGLTWSSNGEGVLEIGMRRFEAPGVEVELAGRAAGRNAVRVHSAAVGRGLSVEMKALSVRNAVLQAGGLRLRCDEVTGTLMLRLFVEGGQLRFAFDLASVKLSGIQLAPVA